MSAVLIVAAGRGTRAGSELPKQYLRLGGQTILARTLGVFLAMEEVTRVTVVIAPGDQAAYRTALDGIADPRLTAPVEGGATRSASVRAGLETLAEDPPETVLIHDAARPFADPDAIRALLDVLKVHDGGFLAVPVIDALWRTDGGFAISPQDRSALWRAQTPQGFRFDKILTAHRAHGGVAADDVEVARASGLLVRIVEGSEANFKITTPADIARAEAVLALE
ncbi:MAG: 2-C-methyl-D-erythritol 4-phosphate cytidylyltransferase [Silicimonas sp.]|nr:2-C-methyl-D-erythritol 4-phosphate cytidylyltransferase [Silicimonas sp.]